MPTFFELRHGLKLAYPDFPGVIPNTPVPKGRCPEVFPIEQLVIMEDQRVPLEKMHKKLSNQLLKVCDEPSSISKCVVYFLLGTFKGQLFASQRTSD